MTSRMIFIKSMVTIVGMGFCGQLGAYVSPYQWKRTFLEITAATPPAVMFVTDDQGRITGPNPVAPFTRYGDQDYRYQITQIPQTAVVSTNIADNDTNVPNANTAWNVNIFDASAQTYLINVIGLSSGFEKIKLRLLFKQQSVKDVTASVSLLVQNSLKRTVKLDYDPVGKKLELKLDVNATELSADVDSACALGEIGPAAACAVLSDLARDVAKDAVTKMQRRDLEAFLKVLARLHHFGEIGNRDWDDFGDERRCDALRRSVGSAKFFAKDPSFSVLNTEARALLDALGQDGSGTKNQELGDRRQDRPERDEHDFNKIQK